MKLLQGTQAQGVVLAETRKAAESVMSAFRQLDADIMVQERLQNPGTDIRAFVVGDYVVAAMRRTANEDNLDPTHRGGVIEPINITEEESRMAIKASKILGLQIAGVDLMRSSVSFNFMLFFTVTGD